MKLSLILFLTIFSQNIFAGGLLFKKASGDSFTDISESNVESECKKNFVFRTEHTDKVPTYLEKDTVKASFTGDAIASLNNAIKTAKAGGKCIWLTPEEKDSVK